MSSSATTTSRFRYRALSSLAGVALVSGGLLVPPISAHADAPAGSVYNLDKEITSARELAVFDKKIDTTGVKATTGAAVAPADTVKATDKGVVAQNSSLLINDLDTEQTLHSAPISVTDVNSVSTSATQGMSLGVEQSVTAKAEFLGTGAEATTTFSASFNASWTQSKTATNSQTYALPEQPVRVAPHRKVRVESWLQKVQIEGVLKPVTTLEGTVDLRKSCGGGISVPIGELMGMLHNDGKPLHPAMMTTEGPVAHFTGDIPFKGVVGTALHVRFFDGGPSSPGSNTPPTSPETKGSGPAAGLPADVVSVPAPSEHAGQPTAENGPAKEQPAVYLNSLDEKAPCPGGQESRLDRQYSSDGWQYGEYRLSAKNVGNTVPYTVTISNLEYLWGSYWYWNRYPAHVDVTVKLTGDGVSIPSQKLSADTTDKGVTLYNAFSCLPPGHYRVTAEVTVTGMWWSKDAGSTVLSNPISVDVTI